jgi:GDP-L-fucose synthase
MPKLKIFIAGHKGMVGSAIFRQLKDQEVEIITKNREQLNLLNQQDVQNFFKSEKIDQVYLAAAKVGGIHANNTYPADFIYQNLTIQNNVIHSAFLSGVKKLLFLGSSCIYPKYSKQPTKEEELLTGKLEPTNEPYALSKIAGIKMCESYNRQYGNSHSIDYRCVMPTNLYGLGDNYHPENSHVIPGLIRRFHEAKVNNIKSVTIWGTGSPFREFLHVYDMARASIQIMNVPKKKYNNLVKPMSHINIGSGKEVSIKALTIIIKKIVGFKGKIQFDRNKPNGASRKLTDIRRLKKIGFKHKIDLEEGLNQVYMDYVKTF